MGRGQRPAGSRGCRVATTTLRVFKLLEFLVQELPYLPDELALAAGKIMVGARDFYLCRAFEQLERRGARIGVLQHLRKIALAVNIEHRQAQFPGFGEFSAADADRSPRGDAVVGTAGEKEVAHARAHAMRDECDGVVAFGI